MTLEMTLTMSMSMVLVRRLLLRRNVDDKGMGGGGG